MARRTRKRKQGQHKLGNLSTNSTADNAVPTNGRDSVGVLMGVVACFVLSGFAALLTAGCNQNPNSTNTALGLTELADVGIFYVGGNRRTGENNIPDQYVGQAQVHFLESTNPLNTPVIMYPGLGLSAYIYLSTPDERPGWAPYFARRGHPTYIYDPVNTGPSGFDVAPFSYSEQTTKQSPPAIQTWDLDQIWPRFGFGAEPGRPHADVRFPVAQMQQFYASLSPRIGGADAGTTRRGMAAMAGGGMRMRGFTTTVRPDPNIPPLIELLQRAGPAVVIAHSIAGVTVISLAATNPELIKAIIVVEPVGCPTDPETVDKLAGIPFLAVYGDYIKSRNQTGRLEACRTTAEIIRSKGGIGTMMELTEQGIFGNTHILMQDNNSAAIADQILAWLAQNVPADDN